MIKKYKKKPVIIEAVEWTGDNINEVGEFMGKENCDIEYSNIETIHGIDIIVEITIHTLEGNMHVDKGDYIIKGIKGEFYPCKPDIFKQTYEAL